MNEGCLMDLGITAIWVLYLRKIGRKTQTSSWYYRYLP